MAFRLWIAVACLVAGLMIAGAGSGMAADGKKTAVATFASGCFWCTESDFDKVPGVLKTISGFMGGPEKNPTYKQVSSGRTGHTEVLQVTYDPAMVSYQKLLDVYWRNVDPHDAAGQFCDRGSQYRPAIFVHTAEQRRLAEASKAKLSAPGVLRKPIIVPITDASEFTAAEAYHQDFYQKNPMHYWSYRIGCGRDRRLEKVWGKKPKS
ncbi:MAG TPA: peptide-methionine (S)-S-oxide reductase MsrA [Hyphomicrobiaceae bacterium]|nr:peptide-methionine (S)-S-oxide reductase MsrA [Hyphomicrobiaceae bacterium]